MSLKVEPTEIPDVRLVVPSRWADDRGFFSETYNADQFKKVRLSMEFVQDNHSLSLKIGTIRGLHFQSPPFEQDKLVRVVRGRILDVAVDLRHSSSTYGQHVRAELSAENWHQLFIPIGFAHGFCTLEPNTEVIYKVSARYSPEHDRGIIWNDPQLGIEWPVTQNSVSLSDKDRKLPKFSKSGAYFE